MSSVFSFIRFDPNLKSAIIYESQAKNRYNYFARSTGNDYVHKLDVTDLCTTNSEISDYTDIEHVYLISFVVSQKVTKYHNI